MSRSERLYNAMLVAERVGKGHPERFAIILMLRRRRSGAWLRYQNAETRIHRRINGLPPYEKAAMVFFNRLNARMTRYLPPELRS